MRKKCTFCLMLLILFINSAAAQETLTPEQELGRELFHDKNLSLNRNQSCATCHNADTNFVDPDNVTSPFFPVSRGSVAGLSGTLNAPSAAYAAFSPHFHWDSNGGLYVGGQFLNGRAPTLAEQAKAPFLNPVEMAMPDEWAVVARLRYNRYYWKAFKEIYGVAVRNIPRYDPRKKYRPRGILEVYGYMTKAIAEF